MVIKYRVELAPIIQKQLKKLPLNIQKLIIKKLELLAMQQDLPNIKKLSGMEGLYRLRVGDYRIIYKIEHEKLVILVLKVGKREDIYNNIKFLV